jgi:hypothetical protein
MGSQSRVRNYYTFGRWGSLEHVNNWRLRMREWTMKENMTWNMATASTG